MTCPDVPGIRIAWKRHNQIRLLGEHLTVPLGSSSSAILFSIQWAGQSRDTAFPSPLTRQPISPAGVTIDQQAEMVFGVQSVQDGPHQSTVSEFAATGDK